MLDRLGDSSAELIPIIKRTNPQELDQGVQLFNAVLDRGAGQTPLVSPAERTARNRRLGCAVLDILRLIYNEVSFVPKQTALVSIPSTMRNHFTPKRAAGLGFFEPAGFFLASDEPTSESELNPSSSDSTYHDG